MSLLRQRFARLPLFRRLCRTAALSTQTPTSNIGWFDTLSEPTTLASPSVPSVQGGAPPPTGDAYPINPVEVNQSKTAEVAQRRLQGQLYGIYCKAQRYNTIISATRPTGHIIKTVSAGALGFKGVNRRSYEAGYQCATSAFKILEEALAADSNARWQLYLNGFGPGREAIQKAVTAAEGLAVKRKLVRVVDKTPIKIGGTRSKKMKRL